jgi:GTPase
VTMLGAPRASSSASAALAAAVLRGERAQLAKSITVIESKRRDHQVLGAGVLAHCLQDRRGRARIERSFRVGVSGPPGAGKSTLIETLGQAYLRDGVDSATMAQGEGDASRRRLSVLAVDPSSNRSGGSILGDKTRMPELARDPRAFIRPSPSRGTLGGVTRSTQDVIPLCEAAGFDFTMVETVGVGQSETAVEGMVDMFVLVVSPAAGDELQGVKKGVVELADLIVVNKADGDFVAAAQRTVSDYGRALHLTTPKNQFWTPTVVSCSAVTGDGIPALLDQFRAFRTVMDEEEAGSTRKQNRRAQQRVRYLRTMFADRVLDLLADSQHFSSEWAEKQEAVHRGDLSPVEACDQLLERVQFAP